MPGLIEGASEGTASATASCATSSARACSSISSTSHAMLVEERDLARRLRRDPPRARLLPARSCSSAARSSCDQQVELLPGDESRGADEADAELRERGCERHAHLERDRRRRLASSSPRNAASTRRRGGRALLEADARRRPKPQSRCGGPQSHDRERRGKPAVARPVAQEREAHHRQGREQHARGRADGKIRPGAAFTRLARQVGTRSWTTGARS